MITVTEDPIDPATLMAAFTGRRHEVGAVASFTGLVRGGTSESEISVLTLQAYPGFTERVMAEIEQEARARFDVLDVLAVHRWGAIAVGDPIIFVAVASAHRRAAFDAVDFLMDQFKTRAPFWKKEEGPGGARWVEPRPQDYDDIARWAETPGQTP